MTENITPPDIDNPDVQRPSTFSKNINKIIAIALLTIAIIIGVMFFWGIESEKVITLNKEPFPTRTIREHPTAGGVVFLTTDFCKTVDTVGEMRLSYVSDTREVFLPLDKEDAKKGCHNEELAVLIPNDITPDTYKVKMRVTYDLNPLKQDVTQLFYSYPVTIDPVTDDNKLPETFLQGSVKSTNQEQ